MKTCPWSGRALKYSHLLSPSFFFFGLVFVFPTFNYSITPAGPHSRYLRSDGFFLFREEADESISCFSGEPSVLADEDMNSSFLTQQGGFPTQ